MARTYPPNRYPNQLVLQISDDMLDRIEADAGAREDRNRSAATRRLIALGILLSDALAENAGMPTSTIQVERTLIEAVES